ncbi:NGG1 interacting factor 3 [Angomonas deanei]|nr:NGG1 interacting factor 3 [Angomonas deanei]|eukprot:EPY42183.1 NGG1 interacting factor 3 [Angomonas deanei]
MSLIKRVSSVMAEIAPLALADSSWDNVGVLVESPDSNKTNKVMLTIDLTSEVMEECIKRNAEVILSYHPPIFSSMKRLTLRDEKQKIILRTIRAGMSIYSPHTSLDAAEGGINDWLASLVDANSNVAEISPIQPTPEAEGGKTGIGRVVRLSTPRPFDQVVESVKDGLHLPTVRIAIPDGWERNQPVTTVAICAGSGTSVFRLLKGKVDVLFTGEMGHHDVLAANAAGRAVILGEHTNTERGYLSAVLAPLLRKKLGDKVEVLVLQKNHDPLVIW